MRGSRQTKFWSHFLLALALLAANVAAPFHASVLGRTLLENLPQSVLTCPVTRVRAVSSVALTQGFHAVVGLAKPRCRVQRGPGRAIPLSAPHPTPSVGQDPEGPPPRGGEGSGAPGTNRR